MRKIGAMAVLTAFLFTVTPAFSQSSSKILEVERHLEFCNKTSLEVMPVRVAKAMIRSANVPPHAVDYANPAKTADGDDKAAEFIFLVENGKAALPGILLKDQRVINALKVLKLYRQSLNAYLNARQVIAGYAVQKTTGRVRTAHFFNGQNVKIKCDPVADSPLLDPTRTPSQEEDEGNKLSAQLNSGFLIRGNVEDLSISKSKLKESSAGKVSFRDDRASDEQAFQTDVTVGFNLSALKKKKSAWSTILYTRYQLIDNRGNNKKDIHSFSPGILFDRLIRPTNWLSARIGLTPTSTFDLKQGAKNFKVKGYFDPSVRVGNNVILGGWKNLTGLIRYRPDFRIIGEGAHVFDNGTSAELADTDQFFGAGGDLSLKVGFSGVPVLSNVVLRAGYRHLEIFSGAIDRANRFSAAAQYTLDDASRFSLSLKYEDGENSETFQKEEFWGVELGVKF